MYHHGSKSNQELLDVADAMHVQMCSGARGLLRTIVELDKRQVWSADGCRDMAEWISGRYDAPRWKARKWVAAAHALESLPRISEGLESGRLCLDKAVELARFATPHDEGKLLKWAQRVTLATVRDEADIQCRRPKEEVEATHRSRNLEWWWGKQSAELFLSGRLPAEDGALLTGVLDEIADRLPRQPDDENRAGENDFTIEERRADALVALARARLERSDGSAGAAAPTVVVHSDLDAILDMAKGAQIERGPVIDPDTLSRLCCDARVQLVIENESGHPIGVGHEQYNAPRWLRRAVEYRHRWTCSFPGCEMRRFLHLHHIIRWPIGPTDVDNLTLVCPLHHDLVHKYGWGVKMDGFGIPRWSRPDGTPFEPRAKNQARAPT